MYRNQLLPRRYPVLTQIGQNDRKNGLNLQWHHDSRPSKPSEFVHATVEDDLIGPGHVRSRSRSRTRETTRRGGQRSSSKPHSAAVRPGLEIHLPQRGRYIVVEDVRHAKKRSSTPEFVLVNKENGRAIPLHSLYHNPQRALCVETPTEPPVDYDKYFEEDKSHRRSRQEKMRKARSMSNLSEDDRHSRHSPVNSTTSSFESAHQRSVFILISPPFSLLLPLLYIEKDSPLA